MRTLNLRFLLCLLLFGLGGKFANGQDAGVSKLLTPINLVCGSSASVISAIVNNYGSTTLTKIPVTVAITGSITTTITDTLRKTIASGKQDTITFSTTINTFNGGNYTFKIYSNLSGDKSHANDTITVTLSVTAFPATPVVKNVVSCGVGPVNLRAVSTAPGSETLWYTSSTTPTIYATGDSISPFISSNSTFYAASVQGAGFGADTTTFSAGNGQTGVMFDVIVNKKVTIDSFDVSPSSSGSDNVVVYYKAGTYNGYSGTASAWTYVGTGAITSAGGTGSRARLNIGGITLQPNTPYGLYLYLNSSNILNYTNGSGSDTFKNSIMKISGGIGVAGSFGSTFSPRDFNGIIYYSTPTCSSPRVAIKVTVSTPVKGLKLSKDATSKGVFNKGTQANPDEICVGDSFKLDLNSPSNYLNSDYGTKWKLTYTMRTYWGFSTTNFVPTAPSASASGKFAFIPKAGDADSVYILNIAATNFASGCDTILTRYIHVNQIAVAQFTPKNVCFGQLFPVSNTSTPAGKLKFVWDFGNSDTSNKAQPLYKFRSAGTYNVTLYAFNAACSSSASQSVTIYTSPYGSTLIKGTPFNGQYNNGDMNAPDNVCLNDTNVYQFLPPNSLTNSDFGKKWIIANVSFTTPHGLGTKDTAMTMPTPTKNGTFSFFPKKYADSSFLLLITLRTIPGNCDSIIRRLIFIRYKPVAIFGFTDACLGTPVSFIDLSTEKESTVSNWSWNFGDGKTSGAQNPNHNYAAPGIYKVALVATSPEGCSGTISKTVQQYPRSIVNFTDVLSCNYKATTFTDASTLATGSIVQWHWSFGDGTNSDSQNVSHVFAKSGPYNVKLVTVTNFGCKDSLIKRITILPTPVASFTYLNKCVGDPIYFSNNSIDSTNKSTYNWSFGDLTTSTLPVPSHTYKSNGTYKAILTVTSKSGCIDTVSKNITPLPIPVPNIHALNGCVGQSLNLSDSSHSGKGSLYAWDFGDGTNITTSAISTNHTYTKTGSYKVVLSISNGAGCSDTESHFVSITNFPIAKFTVNSVCLGKPAIFSNNSSGTGLSYLWDFYDGTPLSSAANPSHLFKSIGTYNVKLKAINQNGCADSTTKGITVNPIPDLQLWGYKSHGYEVTFIPQDSSIGSFVWYFGTPTNDSSSKKSPTFIYPSADKKYLIKLVVTGPSGCVAILTDSLSVTKSGVQSAMNAFKGVSIYPNPFENTVQFSYTLVTSSKVNIGIFDEQGKLVARLRDGEYPAGQYMDAFDAGKYKAPAGVYFLKMYVNDLYINSKIVNMR